MRSLLPLNAALIAAVGIVTILVMVYWHRATRGTWKEWPAGRSLMLLLGIIAVITVNSAINIFLPYIWVGKIELYFGLYFVLLFALGYVGWTIRSEMRKGKARLRDKKNPRTGPVNVIVATANEENPHEPEPPTASIPPGGYWTGAPGGASAHPHPRFLEDGGSGGTGLTAGPAGLSASGDSDSS